jgi:hypothetical protein
VTINDLDLYCRSTVRNIAAREIDEKIRDIILRLIDNNLTSMSMPNSAREITAMDGSVVSDNVLRTNQETLNNAVAAIFKL